MSAQATPLGSIRPDIWGIGFRTADTIAEKMGFGHEQYPRLRSGILYTLNKLSEEGHCYSTREQLLKTGKELLEVEENLLSDALEEMIRNEDLRTEPLPDEEGSAIYLPVFYFAEIGTARRLSGDLPCSISPRSARRDAFRRSSMPRAAFKWRPRALPKGSRRAPGCSMTRYRCAPLRPQRKASS